MYNVHLNVQCIVNDCTTYYRIEMSVYNRLNPPNRTTHLSLTAHDAETQAEDEHVREIEDRLKEAIHSERKGVTHAIKSSKLLKDGACALRIST